MFMNLWWSTAKDILYCFAVSPHPSPIGDTFPFKGRLNNVITLLSKLDLF